MHMCRLEVKYRTMGSFWTCDRDITLMLTIP